MFASISWVDILLYISYVILMLTFFVSLVLPIFSLQKNKEGFVKLIFSSSLLLVIFSISYIFSSDEITNLKVTTVINCFDTTTPKVIGGGLITAYILFLTAFLGIFYTETNSVIRTISN
jgi:preprotein translocase subunit SecY